MYIYTQPAADKIHYLAVTVPLMRHLYKVFKFLTAQSMSEC